MKRIVLDRDVPETWLLRPAVESLRAGGLIVFPTDSVYAFGCDPNNHRAVEKLYRAKQIQDNHRCSVICGDLRQVSQVSRGMSNDAFAFMKRHFPGPYTILLKASRDLPKGAIGDRKKIGVRLPNHPVPLELASAFGGPILVTSVPEWQPGEEIDPVEMSRHLPVRPDLIIDQGPQVANPSTVIDFAVDPPEVVRMGQGEIPWLE